MWICSIQPREATTTHLTDSDILEWTIIFPKLSKKDDPRISEFHIFIIIFNQRYMMMRNEHWARRKRSRTEFVRRVLAFEQQKITHKQNFEMKTGFWFHLKLAHVKEKQKTSQQPKSVEFYEEICSSVAISRKCAISTTNKRNSINFNAALNIERWKIWIVGPLE